ncbi:hypothetical protein K2X85_01135 [bacterium]|nr:hypothetical protein [bacterium]
MMLKNRDERLELLLEAVQQGTPLPGDIPADEWADALELVEIHRQLFDHRPNPGTDFAHRVVASLSETETVSVGGSWRTWLLASSAAALAASLLLVVTISSKDKDEKIGIALAEKAPVALPAPENVTVSDAVRQGTVAYMELVDEITSTLGTAETGPANASFTSTSPLGRAVEGSSRTIRTAGQGLRVSVDPITSSAIDAFGFLWRPEDSAENKPST